MAGRPWYYVHYRGYCRSYTIYSWGALRVSDQRSIYSIPVFHFTEKERKHLDRELRRAGTATAHPGAPNISLAETQGAVDHFKDPKPQLG